MYKIARFCFICFSTTAFAQNELPHSSLRDHLRLSLWYEGIDVEKPQIKKVKPTKKLPVEIEKILINF